MNNTKTFTCSESDETFSIESMRDNNPECDEECATVDALAVGESVIVGMGITFTRTA